MPFSSAAKKLRSRSVVATNHRSCGESAEKRAAVVGSTDGGLEVSWASNHVCIEIDISKPARYAGWIAVCWEVEFPSA